MGTGWRSGLLFVNSANSEEAGWTGKGGGDKLPEDWLLLKNSCILHGLTSTNRVYQLL